MCTPCTAHRLSVIPLTDGSTAVAQFEADNAEEDDDNREDDNASGSGAASEDDSVGHGASCVHGSHHSMPTAQPPFLTARSVDRRALLV